MAGGLPVAVIEVRVDMDGELSERSKSGVAPAALIDGAPAAHIPTKAKSVAEEEEVVVEGAEEGDLNARED